MLLTDADKNGMAERVDTLLQMEHLHGIRYFKDRLYLSTVKEIYAAELKGTAPLAI